ncbi:hypothetical protein FNYG_04002 [Fusarium nygamai]|uniref:Uncharacterized protein n=1 Tax=Gibberella nygamai TaxID=42673 RepID=A0A2K0WKI8_GIBNY|nr:hypothetical protein FNYG_04002 [Fusarium nygamai]
MDLNESREHGGEDDDEDDDEEGFEDEVEEGFEDDDEEGVEEGRVGDRTEEEKETEDNEGVQKEENNERPGLKTEDIGKYIHTAFSLRTDFEDGKIGSIELSELVRQLCPP